jgi:hypothetical protein
MVKNPAMIRVREVERQDSEGLGERKPLRQLPAILRPIISLKELVHDCQSVAQTVRTRSKWAMADVGSGLLPTLGSARESIQRLCPDGLGNAVGGLLVAPVIENDGNF